MEEQLKINSWDISEIVNMIEQYKGNKTITKYIDELLQEATESLLSFGFDPDSVATTMSTIKDDIFKQLNQNKSQNKPTKSSNPDKVDKPHWASGSVTSGTIEVKSVLNTRDGRVIGNAVVADIVYDFGSGDKIGMDGLERNQLTVEQGTGDYANHVIVKKTDTGEFLVIIQNTSLSSISNADFSAI